MFQLLACLFVLTSTVLEASESVPKVNRDLLFQLNRFSPVYRYRSCERDAIARSAESLLESISKVDDPTVRKTLRLYQAVCYFTLGRLDEAKRLAIEITQDKSSMDAFEVKRLFFRIAQVEAIQSAQGDELNPPRIDYRSFRESMANCFPKGWNADYELFSSPRNKTIVLPDGTIMTMDSSRHRFQPNRKHALMATVGRLYFQMNMFEESINANRLAIGMIIGGFDERSARPKRFARGQEEYVGIWECMGDAYAKLGQWENALSCYYKAVASGDPPGALALKLQATLRAIHDGEKPEPPLSRPNYVLLRNVVKYCLETHLFDEAVSAAEAMAKIEGHSTAWLFARIYTEKAEVLERCLRDYETGSIFRGTPITQESVDRAREQARKWSQAEREEYQR